MKSLLRVGLAGVGHVGKMHLLNLCKYKDVKVIGVADKSKKNLRLAKKLGVRDTYGDYTELFERGDLDAAVIALPNFLKLDSVSVALENGVSVLVEKPLTRSFEEAKSLVQAVQALL